MFTRKPIFRSTVRFLVSILFFAAVAMFGPSVHAQVVFSPSMNLSSNYPGGSYSPQIAVDSAGNINVVWVEDNTAQADNGVYFSRSTDGGLTFSAPLNLLLNPGGYSFSGVRLALDSSGNIYVACRLIGTSSQPGQVVFTHSTDGGATFSPRLTLSLLPSLDDPQMGLDSSGNINVAWSENGNTNASHVEFARSTDGGNTFSLGKQIAAEDGTGGRKSTYLVVDSNGGINVMWAGFNIYFTRSSDGGATFSTTQLSSGSVSYNCCSTGLEAPMAVDSSGNIYAVWYQDLPGTTVITRSTDGGVTFSSPQPVSPNTSAPNLNGQIAVDANNIIRILSSTVMLFTRSTDQGSTFSPPQAPVPTNRPLRMQSVGDSKGNIHLVWQDNPNNTNSDVFWSISTDGGVTFSSPQNVSNSSFNSQNPVVASDSRGNAYIVWMAPTGANSTYNVFFSRSVNLSSLTLNPNNLSGGGSTTGTVTLSGPAPSGGATIYMSSSDWNVGGPTTDSVTIPEGATTATLTVSTVSVSQPTSITISGSYAGVDQSATLTVTPPALTTESLNASTVIGGATPAGTVTIDQPAPAAGIVVSLSSSNPAAASVPASVTIPQWATSVGFAVTTSAVTSTTSVTITATSGSVTRTVSLTVMPATLVSLTIDASSVSSGGSCTAMVQLSGPAPSGGAVISLGSSDPNSASVPDSVTVPAGASIAYFPVIGNSVSQPTSVTITAIYQGASQSTSITVTP